MSKNRVIVTEIIVKLDGDTVHNGFYCPSDSNKFCSGEEMELVGRHG